VGYSDCIFGNLAILALKVIKNHINTAILDNNVIKISGTVKMTTNLAFKVLFIDEANNTYTYIWKYQGYKLGDFAYLAKPTRVNGTYNLYQIKIDRWSYGNGRFLVDQLQNIAAKFKEVEK
jgi:hypothetical protein